MVYAKESGDIYSEEEHQFNNHAIEDADLAQPKEWVAKRGPAIPTRGNDISTAWLNEVLRPHLNGHIVLGSQVKPFNEPGQTADIVDISLVYDSARCALPTRMIAKLASLDPDTREMCRTFRHYERETAFYENFRGEDLPFARCFYSRFHPDSLDAVILLEHLTPSYSPAYSISLDQVRLAVQEVAKLHTRWWNDDFVKQQSALVQLDDPEHWRNAADGAVAAIAQVQELVGDACSASIQAMRIFADRVDDIMAFAATRPFTLMHSDYHAKQMFFPNEKGEGKFAVIDFQFSVAGPGAYDVSRLINLGMATDVRRKNETQLVSEYLTQLERLGVPDYDLDAFLIDHKIGILLTQLINFIAIAQTDQALVEQECREHGLDWKEVWLMRGEAMMQEQDVPGFLRGIQPA